jgi:hypothetical protein
VIKAGIIYGKGDHMLDHLSHALYTCPLFPAVGIKDRQLRPLAVKDLADILHAALADDRLSRQTVAVTQPEEVPFSELPRRLAQVIKKRVWIFRLPLMLHYFLAWCFERFMTIPLISLAQVRILAEDLVEAAPGCEPLPDDLAPRRFFTEQQIRNGLPKAEPFCLKDFRCFSGRSA